MADVWVLRASRRGLGIAAVLGGLIMVFRQYDIGLMGALSGVREGGSATTGRQLGYLYAENEIDAMTRTFPESRRSMRCGLLHHTQSMLATPSFKLLRLATPSAYPITSGVQFQTSSAQSSACPSCVNQISRHVREARTAKQAAPSLSAAPWRGADPRMAGGLTVA